MQTAHLTDRPVAREGAIATAEPTQVITRFVDEATGIKPGRFVAKAAGGDRHVELTDAETDVTGQKLLGVSLLDEGSEPLTNGVYADNSPMPVLRKGVVWMIAEDAVAAGGDVFVRHTGGGAGEELGRVRSDADGTDADQAPGCVFRTSTSGVNQLVQVEINLPVAT